MKNFIKYMLGIVALFAVFGAPTEVFGITIDLGREAVYATVVTSPVFALNSYQGRHERKLFSTLMNGLEVFQDVDLKRRVKSKLQLTKLSIGDGLRPYAGGAEQLEGEDIKYTGTTLEVHTFQRDFSVEIERYKETWLEEELRPSEGSSSKQRTIPFAEYTTNKIIEKLKSELNDKTAYFGFDKTDATTYDAGSTYSEGDYIKFTENTVVNYYKALDDTAEGESPTTHASKWQKVNAEAVAPGFGHIIQGLISDGAVTEETIGTIDNDNIEAYAAHTELYRAHTAAYRKHGVVHYCSYDQFDLLLDSLEKNLTKYTEKDNVWVARGIILPKTNRKCVVLPCSWMSGSDRIISTPKNNLLGGTDLESDHNTMKTREATNYIAVTSIKGRIGFAIRDPEALVINDKA